MRFNSISSANTIKWDGKSRPFYEVYYLKLVDPKREWSLWLRYTLLIPEKQHLDATASVWGIVYSVHDVPLTIKQTYSLADHDVWHQDHFINIAGNYLSIDASSGHLENEDEKMEWSFHFEDPTDSLSLYPYQFLYSKSFPRTKFVEPRLVTHVSGTIKINDHVLRLNRNQAHQAHVWGTQYASTWVWGHCSEFEEDETAYFEGLSAQVPLGKAVSPPVSLFCFRVDGQKYFANSVWKWFSNHSNHHLQEWHFEVRCGSLKFIGHVSRDVESIIGIRYDCPQGDQRFCHNTMMANMTLTVYKKQKKNWVFWKKLTSKQGVAFETVGPKEDPRVKYYL